MTFALFMRRWVILASGALLLVLGAVILNTHLPIALGWVEYAPVSGMAFYPGLASAPGSLDGVGTFESYASFGGQISIALGTALITGWIGFALGRRA
jgi:hypothetical protein